MNLSELYNLLKQNAVDITGTDPNFLKRQQMLDSANMSGIAPEVAADYISNANAIGSYTLDDTFEKLFKGPQQMKAIF